MVDRGIIEAHLEAIDALNEQIEKLERTIEEVAGADEDTQRLMSIPRVSYFTSLLINSEIGVIDRFPSPDQLVSYAGLDPSVRQSGNKKIRGGITKEGSAPLRRALGQCATVAVRFDEYLENFYTRLEERKDHQVAIVATARKNVRHDILHALQREGVRFQRPGLRPSKPPATNLLSTATVPSDKKTTTAGNIGFRGLRR